MYIRIIENQVKKEKLNDYKTAMKNFVKDLELLDDCISIDIVDIPEGIATIERWQKESKDAGKILSKHKKFLKEGFICNQEKVYSK